MLQKVSLQLKLFTKWTKSLKFFYSPSYYYSVKTTYSLHLKIYNEFQKNKCCIKKFILTYLSCYLEYKYLLNESRVAKFQHMI